MPETVNSTIFRAYDIRGVVDVDLNDHTLTTIGKAAGTWAQEWGGKTFVVGRDARCSSLRFQEAFTDGLCSTGVNVIDIGQVPTPVMYFAVEYLQADGGAIISASHNPPEYNGVKLRRRHPDYGSEPIESSAIAHIGQLANRGDFLQGNGTRISKNIQDAYVESVSATLQLPDACKKSGCRPRIVLDGGNGVAGPIAVRTLETLGIDVIPLYIEPDGRFPNHHPDPLKTKNLRDMSEMVRKHGADLGLALDGDGDRLGVVDSQGDVVWADRYLIILSRYLLAQRPAPVVFDIKCSSVLAQSIEAFGGSPIMWKTGYASISAKMRSVNAILGGELSGHTFSTYPRHYYDDGTFAGAHLIHSLCHLGQQTENTRKQGMLTLSDALVPYPVLPAIKDERIYFSDTTKFQVVEHVRERFGNNYPITSIDGVRVHFEDGWGVVRASNTEPMITMGFEAATEERLQTIRTMIVETVEEFREQLGSRE